MISGPRGQKVIQFGGYNRYSSERKVPTLEGRRAAKEAPDYERLKASELGVIIPSSWTLC